MKYLVYYYDFYEIAGIERFGSLDEALAFISERIKNADFPEPDSYALFEITRKIDISHLFPVKR